MLNYSVIFTSGSATYPVSVTDTMAQLGDSGVAWLDFVNPTSQELEQLKETFRLHELAIRDIVQDRQRPKVETYGATRFMVLRPARILEDRVHTLEFYLFVGPNFVMTARHKDFPDLASAARDLGDAPELTRKFSADSARHT